MPVAQVRRRRLHPDQGARQLRVLVAHAVDGPVEVDAARGDDRLAEPEQVPLGGAELPLGPVLHLLEVDARGERPAVPRRHPDVDPLRPPVAVGVDVDGLHARVAQERQSPQIALGLVDELAVDRVAGCEQQLAADHLLPRPDVHAVRDPVGREDAARPLVEDLAADDLDGAYHRRRGARGLLGGRRQREQTEKHRADNAPPAMARATHPGLILPRNPGTGRGSRTRETPWVPSVLGPHGAGRTRERSVRYAQPTGPARSGRGRRAAHPCRTNP